MDVSNKGCAVGVQNNVNANITNNIVFQSTPSTSNADKKNQDFHLLKTVKSFQGRDVELEQLNTWLFQDNKKMAAICGLPGYGKTELARRFAHHCKERELVRSVLWLDAETPSVLEQSLRDLLRWLGASDTADLDVRSVVQAVHQHFSAGPHLFVLDNALDRRHMLGFEPEGECRCIVTSHLEDWGDDVPPLQLAPLSVDAAVDVLRAELKHRFHEEDLEQYKHLAELLCCVPLALQVAAAYVRQEFKDLDSDFRLCDYVERLQVPSIIGQTLPDSSANTYDKTFLQAIKISLHKILNATNYDSKLATDILYICAYLNPEKIFYSTLLEIPCLRRALENCEDPKTALKKVCALLRKYSFIISVENEKISIHRLIQQILCQIPENQMYFYCLELLLDYSKNTTFHAHFILKYAEYRLEVFQDFCTKYKLIIVSNQNHFWHVIHSNCKIFLVTILDELGDSAADIINVRCLLHCAVLCQQYSILELMLEKYKPNVDERAGSKDTPLILAAWNLDLRAIKTLVSHKADVNIVADGDSVLHEVIRASGLPQNFGRSLDAVEAVRMLAGCGARTDAVGRRAMSLVHTAALALSPELVRCLVQEFGCDVNAVDLNKRTPLYYVAGSLSADRGRQQDTVKCLLELGARRDVKDIVGRTPAEDARNAGQSELAYFIENPSAEIQENEPVVYELRGAVARGDLAALTRLLEELGERALQVSNESYLLYEAVLYNEYDILETLLARGVDVDCRTTDNYSALHRAAWTLDTRAMEQLVEHGADVNAVDATGHCVLHDLVRGAGEAKRAGRGEEACEALRWLVGRGARTDVVTSHGHSLLHTASEALSPELVRCLVTEHNLDVNAVDAADCTPLFWISAGLRFWQVQEVRGLKTAACLLELGARAHLHNGWGSTPADVARANGHPQLGALLDIAAAAADGVKMQAQISERDEVDTAAAVEDNMQVQLKRAATAAAMAALGAVCAWKFLRY